MKRCLAISLFFCLLTNPGQPQALAAKYSRDNAFLELEGPQNAAVITTYSDEVYRYKLGLSVFQNAVNKTTYPGFQSYLVDEIEALFREVDGLTIVDASRLQALMEPDDVKRRIRIGKSLPDSPLFQSAQQQQINLLLVLTPDSGMATCNDRGMQVTGTGLFSAPSALPYSKSVLTILKTDSREVLGRHRLALQRYSFELEVTLTESLEQAIRETHEKDVQRNTRSGGPASDEYSGPSLEYRLENYFPLYEHYDYYHPDMIEQLHQGVRAVYKDSLKTLRVIYLGEQPPERKKKSLLASPCAW